MLISAMIKMFAYFIYIIFEAINFYDAISPSCTIISFKHPGSLKNVFAFYINLQKSFPGVEVCQRFHRELKHCFREI